MTDFNHGSHARLGDDEDLRGVLNPDFLALGLGGTNMMAMLWSVAMGQRTVGVEMRGEPSLGVHWNIREDMFHQLGLVDQLMLDRYGEEWVPKRGDGSIFKLADCFYHPDTIAGQISADEVITCFETRMHVGGTIDHIEFIDDRYRDGKPSRTITRTPPVPRPAVPDPSKIRTDMAEVLDGPSTFQTAASELLRMWRRYLEKIEEMDLAAGLAEPRVRMFLKHRVIPTEGDGFIPDRDGRMRIRIESVQEMDYRGRFVRMRAPGTDIIDIGMPELFVIAEGFFSSDAERLGFHQHDVEVDHQDGRGPVVAQADYLAGFCEVLVDGRLRRRISSEFDKDGNEYWVRQIAVGHEDDPEVGWILVQVPDFETFDPIAEGLVPPDTDRTSPEYFAGYQQLLYQCFITHAAAVLEMEPEELAKIQMDYGPKLFSLIERIGDDARIARNGLIAGDSFGNGHFLTSGGANCGIIGHTARILRYWQDRAAGVSAEQAIQRAAAGIKEDTEAWLHVSAPEFSQAAPINFGAERIRQISEQSGIKQEARATTVDASRRFRHKLVTLDYSDWRRLFIRGGRLRTEPLPPLDPEHPALRAPKPAHETSRVTVG
ncbi:hypothetical protein [Actinoalloteichus hymeniacidonis]|uniref:Uncharacterized protein n=1 Tax=Actinoalloteichus hymeniacidonis TaxID=340345 RepID=A0AAC9HMQ6_9PSEU|nr:hypothetical protein [Actinoalloteichus hymeniacidonis]AOS61998.1 hypothetical protein TL08_05865 [Actinoalloteichus hymeniacidonis]MBB5909980.1 hypothetical protein [Actinoalloteichus hymeniacidonis]